jgi:hypothetical protein
MRNTKDAILKLNSGKTIHGIVIEQNIQPETVAFINYRDVESVGQKAIHTLLQLIPVSQIRELDYCIK